MNALPKRRSMTLAEFLDWEERQEERHEYLDGEITAMVGEAIRHSRIAGNVHIALATMLKRTPCRVFQEGVRVVTAFGVFYPDVFVTCAKLVDTDRVVAEPKVIFEVLSPSTGSRDLFSKREAYQTLDSLQQYVIVAQDDLAVESIVRQGEDWMVRIARGRTGLLALPSLGFELPLATIYEDTDLLAAAQADEA